MKCPRCQHENQLDAVFCEECGSRLEGVCPNCGAQNRAGAKFCRKCGGGLVQAPGTSQASPSRFSSPEIYTPKHLAEKILTSRSALEGERKQITVLFADLKGSMELLADRDPEEARKLLDPVLKLMMEAVHHYEGSDRPDTRQHDFSSPHVAALRLLHHLLQQASTRGGLARVSRTWNLSVWPAY